MNWPMRWPISSIRSENSSATPMATSRHRPPSRDRGPGHLAELGLSFQETGGRGEVPRDLVDRLADGAGASGDDFPVFSQAPLYIRESLTFPYTEGMRFQDAVYRELGPAAFERVFRDPPRSTQQIMHPETYLAGRMPAKPACPAWRRSRQGSAAFSNPGRRGCGRIRLRGSPAPVHRRNGGPRGRVALAGRGLSPV